MINRKKFFDGYRSTLDPNRKLDQSEVNAITVFLDFADASWKMFSVPQWAYIFATTFHETKATFLPVKEAFWLSEDWRKRNLRYYPYYGRGYVQITWKDNYFKFSKSIGEDFVKNPDLVMIPKYAFKILIDGFRTGAFTGKKISDYINDKEKDYEEARRCINGEDRKELIAGYAILFEKILS
ncbi:glycoside hydrolase family 19 protein [Chryseobacterium sp. SG20098]|uniref:glycoside hydrolase family 19 protein n=1 Tax=Chryseobacterium sp. SG20098 TaxID=3074145 RepID=UPI0028834A85|nr:glycoside hydrolase family 19 protein [Chryseobacterium sp. SG20098]WNI34698.1 glycoside hydrolase family 19 protein [Chryseobacterium sp. SG20098]